MSLVDRYRSWRLGRAIARGDAVRGRVELDPAEMTVKVPVKVTMSARVIRTDGSVEEVPIRTAPHIEVDPGVLAELRRQAEEG